jgi:hypothetical protein
MTAVGTKRQKISHRFWSAIGPIADARRGARQIFPARRKVLAPRFAFCLFHRFFQSSTEGRIGLLTHVDALTRSLPKYASCTDMLAAEVGMRPSPMKQNIAWLSASATICGHTEAIPPAAIS